MKTRIGLHKIKYNVKSKSILRIYRVYEGYIDYINNVIVLVKLIYINQ